MIKFIKSWRKHKAGDEVQLHEALERRLVQINKAKRMTVETPELEIPHYDTLKENGIETVEQILAADLTLIDGIGEKTADKIKQAVKDVR